MVWRKYTYYFLCLFEFSVPVWLGLRNANTKKKLKTVKLEQIKWIQVWKTAGKMKLNSQWIILKGKCSRWLHKDYSKDWTSIRTEPTRGWGAGGVKWRNTGERNDRKNTRNSGRADEGDAAQVWRENQAGTTPPKWRFTRTFRRVATQWHYNIVSGQCRWRATLIMFQERQRRGDIGSFGR